MSRETLSGYYWSHTQLEMDVRQAIHGEMHLFGAYDLQADQIWLIHMDNKDTDEFCDVLRELWFNLFIGRGNTS